MSRPRCEPGSKSNRFTNVTIESYSYFYGELIVFNHTDRIHDKTVCYPTEKIHNNFVTNCDDSSPEQKSTIFSVP